MRFIRCLALIFSAGLLAPLPASASHLVTGNGFGFGVVSPESGTVTKFYAHPYSFVRPDPKHPLSEGIETANFLQSIGWKQPGAPSSSAQAATADYEDDSQIIHIRRSDGEGIAFMPFNLRRPALIVSWEPNTAAAQGGELEVEWTRPISAQWVANSAGVEMHVLKFDGIAETLLLIPLGAALPGPANAWQVLASHLSWALISLEEDSEVEQAAAEFNRWRAGLSPRALATREIAELEHWRVKPAVHFASDEERHLWRQSEVMLRMAQSREANGPDGNGNAYNGNGLIVAALPDGVYFTPWVRDMAYALVALIRMGHQAEARAGLLAYFNAQPTGKMRAQTGGIDYQISVVRYFGDGAEEPFFTQEGAINIEYDDWGLALWVLGEYVRKFDDPHLLSTATYRGLLYPSARDFVVRPLLRTLESYGGGEIVSADTSIWEEHQPDKKHFAWSTAMAIVGLEYFAEVARRAGDEAARTDALKHEAALRKGFAAAFVRGGELHGTLEPGEKNDIDGAMLAIINFGVVTDSALIRNTVARMEMLKVVSGGYKRVRSNYTDPAIFEFWYEKEEFLFIDFSLAEVDRRLGETAESDETLKRIVAKAAADHNIIPEMYVAVPCKLFPGEVGDPTGALPMVGYGAGEYIQYILARESLERRP
jgi:hypothetical protein